MNNDPKIINVEALIEPPILIQWLGGVKEFKPVKYTVRSVETGKWWWKKTNYYIDSEFVSIGPMTAEEVVQGLNVLNR